MSSVLRAYSQIPRNISKFIVIGDLDLSAAQPPSYQSAFVLDPGAHIMVSSIATNADITLAAGDIGYSVSDSLLSQIVTGVELKDLGRQITIYDPALPGDLHVALFRQVQLISGVDTEGVAGSAPAYNSNLYVKVWSADGAGVKVVRTG